AKQAGPPRPHPGRAELPQQSPAAAHQHEPQSQLSQTSDQGSAGQTPAEDELEAFWLKLLDEVLSMQSLHSILSNYPFPVSLDQKEFTIGVNNDMWRNNVEKRMEPIKTACERVLGRQIAIKVKDASSVLSRQRPRD